MTDFVTVLLTALWTLKMILQRFLDDSRQNIILYVVTDWQLWAKLKKYLLYTIYLYLFLLNLLDYLQNTS